MEDNQEWGEVEVPHNEEDKVEYEIEKEEEEVTQEKEELKVEADEVKDKEPQELEGIETSGAQKRIRQLVKQRKEREEQIELLRLQNEELNKKLVGKENEVQSMGKRTLAMSEKQLTDKIQLAREVYLEAFEEGEKEKLLNAQEMLNEAQNDLKAVNSAKARYAQQASEYSESTPVVQEQQVPQAVSDPKAEQWASDNDWFGKDNIMTAAALAIDAELKNEGYDPSDNDFYQEIDNRIKASFPHKFGEDQERVQETTSSPAQVVSGSSRSSPSSRKKIKLSQEDLRLAQKWNIPLETYAAQKLKVHQADGDYTDIK
tara:strand:+ start:3404 stop:4351 length:948 start_codon:yes stop_codon:yes gene_type:complete